MRGAGLALLQRGLRVLLQATPSIRLPARRQPKNKPQAGKRMGELLRMGSPAGRRLAIQTQCRDLCVERQAEGHCRRQPVTIPPSWVFLRNLSAEWGICG